MCVFNILIYTNNAQTLLRQPLLLKKKRLLEVPIAVAFLFYDAQSNILDDQKLEVENVAYVSAPDSGKNFN